VRAHLRNVEDVLVARMELPARMGLNRTTLLSRMKKLGIHSKQYGA
jgi:hypothetical protein